MVKRWNEKYEWPKLQTAVARDFLDYIRATEGGGLRVYRAAWPDWWTDGFGSAARETAAARATHAEMLANLGLPSIAKLAGADLPEHLLHEVSAVLDGLFFMMSIHLALLNAYPIQWRKIQEFNGWKKRLMHMMRLKIHA
ncbi:hypothetical protein GF407_13890 [candidate division KSB1 bacterium]|nr:hypothetical protein [candidate division KSB1 bacterium]